MTLGSGSHAESAMAAYARRQGQLDSWHESDTAKESTEIRNRPKRVKFADRCIFQAACASNDKAQILKMLQEGYDINCVDEDGITALHQACIDDNYEMVEFLLANGADVNISDNEGWTPLHAVASCCYVSITKLLLDHGANVVALNNDCCIPLDICKNEEIKEMFKQDINAKGINLHEARREEEIRMMEDAKKWITYGSYDEIPHPTTGAVGLHVAACKGYIKVLDLLIKAGANINQKDVDGWTPLHAAAHWGQKEACEVLLENLCDISIKNNCDQNALDVADDSVISILEDYKKKQDVNRNIDSVAKQPNILPLPPKKKAPKAVFDDISKTVSPSKKGSEEDEDESEEASEAADTVGDLPVADSVAQSKEESALKESNIAEAADNSNVEDDVINKTGDTVIPFRDEERNSEVITESTSTSPLIKVISTSTASIEDASASASNSLDAANAEDNTPAWRRGGSLRTRNNASGTVDDKSGEKSTVRRTRSEATTGPEVNLRRAYSFESDSKFYARLTSARSRIKAMEAAMTANSLEQTNHNAHQESSSLTSIPLINTLNNPPVPACSSLEVILRRRDTDAPRSPRPTTISSSTPQQHLRTSPASNTSNSVQMRSPSENGLQTSGAYASTGSLKVGPVSKFKQFLIKSFVPPTRDEESETQRKAHAKRVRETRRSTQGVTLEELKSAEQYVKNSQQANAVSPSNTDTPTPVPSSPVPASLSIALRKDEDQSLERRPSWRLRVDDSDRNKFSLEDTRNPISRNSPSYNNVPNTSNETAESLQLQGSPSSRRSNNVDTSIYSGRPPRPPLEESQGDPDKDKDVKNSGAQGAILRKKKTKRRSTGVVQYNADEIDPDLRESNNSDTEGGSGRGSDYSNDVDAGTESSRSENGVSNRINYRKLYEEVLKENLLLKSRLTRYEEEVADLKNKLEKVTVSNQRFGSDESERREKRALELKMEAMELELREVRHLKSENQKIRDENGALIRVISKLSK